MMIWESSYDIMDYCDSVPEVVGTLREVIYGGALPKQKESIPAPKCKAVGYTPLEWLRHWAEKLKRTIMRADVEEKRQEYMRMIRRKIA